MLFKQFGRFAKTLCKSLTEHRQTFTAKTSSGCLVLGSDANSRTLSLGRFGAGDEKCLTFGLGSNLLVGGGNDACHRVGDFFVERKLGDLQVDNCVAPTRKLFIQGRLGVVHDFAAKAKNLRLKTGGNELANRCLNGA